MTAANLPAAAGERALPDHRPARPGPPGGAVSSPAFVAAGDRDHGGRIERRPDEPTGQRQRQLDRDARHERFGSGLGRPALGLEATAGGQFSGARGRGRLDRRQARMHVEFSARRGVGNCRSSFRPRPTSIWRNWPPSWRDSSTWPATNWRGPGRHNLTCQTDAAGQFTAQGDADVRDFALDAPTRLPWREPRVTLHAEASGSLSQGVPRQIASASLRLETQSDQLVVAVVAAGRQSGRKHLSGGDQLARRSGRP